MKDYLHSHRGFSLVELLIAMALVGVIMGAVYSLYATAQRTSYSQDETVEVQQNLRIAMDTVTRDLRMAGMLVDYGSSVLPIQSRDLVTNAPFTNYSTSITMNMASATATYAKINSDVTPAASPAVFPVSPATNTTRAGDGDVLQVDDKVRIINPLYSTQRTLPTGEATFNVNAVVRQVKLSGETGYIAPTVTLANATGETMANVEFKRGDMIAKVNVGTTSTATPSPNTIQYSLVRYAAAPATAATDPSCPVSQLCLARRLNNESISGIPVWQIVAQNITSFKLSYIMDDNSVSKVPADLPLIKGVMVAISGETVTTKLLSAKSRQLTSVVKLRNRR